MVQMHLPTQQLILVLSKVQACVAFMVSLNLPLINLCTHSLVREGMVGRGGDLHMLMLAKLNDVVSGSGYCDGNSVNEVV